MSGSQELTHTYMTIPYDVFAVLSLKSSLFTDSIQSMKSDCSPVLQIHQLWMNKIFSLYWQLQHTNRPFPISLGSIQTLITSSHHPAT